MKLPKTPFVKRFKDEDEFWDWTHSWHEKGFEFSFVPIGRNTFKITRFSRIYLTREK